MSLFIANCTKQTHSFIFRVPESQATQKREIPPGGQVQIFDDGVPPAHVDNVIRQHERYGLIDAAAIDRTKAFIGICYSTVKPVTVNRIMSAVENNEQALTNMAGESRRNAVAAMHQSMSDSGPLNTLEVELVEDKKDRQDADGFGQILQVTQDGKPKQRAGRKRPE